MYRSILKETGPEVRQLLETALRTMVLMKPTDVARMVPPLNDHLQDVVTFFSAGQMPSNDMRVIVDELLAVASQLTMHANKLEEQNTIIVDAFDTPEIARTPEQRSQ